MSQQLELRPSLLPGGWSWASLSDIIREPLRNGHSARESKTGRGIPTLTLTAVTKGDFENNIKITTADEAKVTDMWLKPGDIFIQRSNAPRLVGTARLYLGRPNLAIFPDLLIRIRAHHTILSEYVGYFLESHQARNYFRRSAKGIAGSMPKISQGVVEKARIPIPPLPEQHEVVSALSTHTSKIDAAITGLKRVQANLKRYRASVLKAAVEGRLVPTEAELARQEGRDYEPASVLLAGILAERRRRWEEAQLAKMKAKGKTPKDDKWKAKYKEPAAPDTEGLPELPEGWCWASLEALTCGHRVICYGILMPKENLPGGVPYVKVRDMRSGRLVVDKLQRTSPEIAAKYQRSMLDNGDILLAIRGTYGRVVHVPANLKGGNITQDSARLDFLPGLDRGYMASCLKSPLLQEYFKRVARGVAVKGVNIKDVRLAPIPVPPSAEQIRIEQVAEDLESVAGHTLITAVASDARCQRLRQSILKWAFEGKLVDQDPNDEPASVLLERIRAEREAAATTSKKKPTRKRRKKKASK